MAARKEVDAPPEEFRTALDQLRAAKLRPEVFCEEMPAPQRIAPYAAALSADVTVGGEEVGGGRLVLLYDPAGNPPPGRAASAASPPPGPTSTPRW
jgi:hypothetical protein